MAIFQNEEDLLNGAYRAYPFLKKSTDDIEYGFRLKEFPDGACALICASIESYAPDTSELRRSAALLHPAAPTLDLVRTVLLQFRPCQSCD